MPAPAASLDHLEGTLEHVVFANEENGWMVARLEVEGRVRPVTVVGLLGDTQVGEFLHLAGRWQDDPKFGEQFAIESFRSAIPTTLAAIERYLGSGLIRGVGKVMAKRLVERFGERTLDVIEKSSAELEKVPGIGRKRSRQIHEAWLEQREIKEVMLFLQAHQVGTSNALRIWKTYGTDAVAIVRENPYRLATDIFGIGFKTADAIAANLGIPPTSPHRAAAAVQHLLVEATDRGHLFLPRGDLLSAGEQLLGVGGEIVEAAIDALAEQGALTLEGAGSEAGRRSDAAVYLRHLYAAEVKLADRLARLATTPPEPLDLDLDQALAWFEQREAICLAAEQREAIRRALACRVLVITGGPGTGKTTLVRGIVSLLARQGRRVLLAAPTGRAAKRLAEATGAEAKTVHRLLEWNPRTLGFSRGADAPLEGDVLIVDEASMLDLPLAQAVVEALPERGHLILVGDVDQLPSVGPGSVLGDLIRSRVVEVIRLTEIFRQASQSAIVVNAHRINRGEMPLEGEADGADFFFIERNEPEAVLETLKTVVSQRIPKSFGLDPLQDIQVLTPMNRGLLGVVQLNQALRELLNPQGKEVARGGRVLRVGDKVMQVRNNYDLEVFNGDLGRITSIDGEEQMVEVRFEGRRVLYELADLDELVPAFACSIHKSQGSEYPAVVLPVHSQHYVMLERNLIYTALTRARRLAVLIGERRALGIAVSNRRVRRRFSHLAERLAAAAG